MYLEEAEEKATSGGNNRFIAEVIWEVREATSYRLQGSSQLGIFERPKLHLPIGSSVINQKSFVNPEVAYAPTRASLL